LHSHQRRQPTSNAKLNKVRSKLFSEQSGTSESSRKVFHADGPAYLVCNCGSEKSITDIPRAFAKLPLQRHAFTPPSRPIPIDLMDLTAQLLTCNRSAGLGPLSNTTFLQSRRVSIVNRTSIRSACNCMTDKLIPVPVSLEAKLSFVEPGHRWAHSQSPSKAPGTSYQGTKKTSARMLKTSRGLSLLYGASFCFLRHFRWAPESFFFL